MKLLAIDGNSLINRAFYGVRMLTSSKGVPTNAVFGFFNMYLRLIEEHRPECVCVCFDVKAKTFRHIEYDGYKAQRRPMPEELKTQMPIIKEMLDYMGVPRLEAEGYEADDLLGTLARLCKESGMECIIVTGDKDSLQFIEQDAKVALVTTRMGNTSTEIYNRELFAEKYCGLEPQKIIDLKAIMGDASDNIPGVKGIGEKGAMNLLCAYRSLDGIYENIDSKSITESTRKKLIEGKESAYLSYWLATGCLEAPVGISPDKLTISKVDNDNLYDLLNKLELRSIIKRMELTPTEKKTESYSFALPTVQRVENLDSLHISEGDTLLVNKQFTAGALCTDDKCYVFSAASAGDSFERFLAKLGGYKLSVHDCKSFASSLLKEGKTPPEFVFDTALAGYLLDPTANNYSIAALAEKYLDIQLPEAVFDDEDAFDLLGGGDEAFSALAFHCSASHALKSALQNELKKTNMESLLYDIELPLSMVLAQMENDGIGIDKARLAAFGQELTIDIDRLEQEIYDLAGEQFNISSPKQLSEILYDKLGLNPGKKTKTGRTTNADTLEKLKFFHPVVEKILDYRKLTKLKSTYVDGLIKTIDADGRIYGKFNQTVTATGRLSSTEPNLQNIPVRRELGAEIRKCFVPREGWVFADADYSQIELRILAHIADDSEMKKAFSGGEDIHTVTASQVFKTPIDEVTSLMRSRAKAVNFGIVYGISGFSLSEDIGVSVKEAKGYIDAYLEHYSGVREYMERIKTQAEADGFVSTVYGRRRYLPELKSSNFNIRAFGQRVALNAPIQGTAADVIKIAMIKVAQRLEAENLQARLILQVHDELIVECPASEQEQVKTILQDEMENAADLSVKLLAEVAVGENWYDAKK